MSEERRKGGTIVQPPPHWNTKLPAIGAVPEMNIVDAMERRKIHQNNRKKLRNLFCLARYTVTIDSHISPQFAFKISETEDSRKLTTDGLE